MDQVDKRMERPRSKRADRTDQAGSERAQQTDQGRSERAKVATSLVFALNGWTFATWASRIPTVRDELGLDARGLGLLLLVGSAGSVLGLPLAGKVAHRFGSARTVLVGASLMLAALALCGLSVGTLRSVPLTAGLLFVLFFGMGQWDVAMNLEGAAVEQRLGRTVMPRYHAAFSLGTVTSAITCALLLAWLALPLLVHFAVTSAVVAVLVVRAVRAFLPHGDGPAESPAGDPTAAADRRPRAGEPSRSAWTEPRTLLIGVVVLVAAFTEGTANDWMSVAFIDGYQLPDWAGVLGFATFLGLMTLGRVAGTNLLDRYGRLPVLRVLLVLAGVGSLLVVFGTPALAFLGAAVWGFGVSLGFPVGMSAAADDPVRAPARVSVVSTIGYLAFLAGPPLLGFLGDHYGVLRALTVVSVLLIVALIALPALRPLSASEHAESVPRPG